MVNRDYESPSRLSIHDSRFVDLPDPHKILLFPSNQLIPVIAIPVKTHKKLQHRIVDKYSFSILLPSNF